MTSKFFLNETENEVGMRKLVELIFVKKFQVTAEMTAQDSSFPPCLLTNDFPRKLRCVLMIRQAIVSEVWRKSWSQVMDVYASNWLSSSKAYLTSVLSACIADHTGVNKAYDGFLGVCGLVRFFSIQISQETGMNFYDFNTDVVLEFYESFLKNAFFRCGGFRWLVGYIHQHKYLKWNLDMNDLAALDDPSAHVNAHTAERLGNELIRERKARQSFIAWKKANNWKLVVDELESLSESIAERILSNTSVKLYPVACSHDPNPREGVVNLNEKAKSAVRTMEIKAALKSEPLGELPRCLGLKSDSKANHAVKQKAFIPVYERIIQAVIKHNRSKSSDLMNWDNQLLEKANEILDHLKDTIKSLTELLDEYDKE